MNLESFSLELAEPLETAAGTIDRRDGYRLTLRAFGERGVGEATPLPGWTESLEECRGALSDGQGLFEAHAEPDEDSANRELSPALERIRRRIDPRETPAASHALESAVLDAWARSRDRPAYQVLGESGVVPSVGGGRRDRVETVPVNATFGDADVDSLRAAATAAVDSGFECLKCKVGVGPLERDIDRLRALREAVDEEVSLRADANASWSRGSAERAIDDLAAVGCSLLEQPLAPDALAAHASLRGRGVPIGLDEGVSCHAVAAINDANAADAIVCKPMALGGPFRTVGIAAQARGAGIDPIVSTTIDGAIGRAAAVHVAAAIPEVPPCGLATANRLRSDLAPDPAPIVDGAALVPQGPGLGVEPRGDRDG